MFGTGRVRPQACAAHTAPALPPPRCPPAAAPAAVAAGRAAAERCRAAAVPVVGRCRQAGRGVFGTGLFDCLTVLQGGFGASEAHTRISAAENMARMDEGSNSGLILR